MAISDEIIAKLDPKALQAFVDGKWDKEIVPNLTQYIEIPAKSPMFDAAWEQNGYIDKVARDAADWIRSQKVQGLTLELIKLPGRTPVLFFEVPATGNAGTDTVFMYGHLDKQPEFSGWRNGFGPWTPRYVDDKLYGRGGADDGYAVYAALTAIQALDAQNLARPRCVGLIETCEESGSYDLLPYIDALKPRLGEVSLVVCLDSGAGNYDQLWLSTSLRGAISGSLEVQVLEEGVHSGESSGVIPSTFRIMRQLIDRLEDSKTGRLLPSNFHCEIPAERLQQARQTAEILGDEVWKNYPWSCGADGNSVLPMVDDPFKALINRTWNPTLSVTGAEGLPPLADAGNVLRPRTAFKLSIRLPPLVEAAPAVEELKNLLEVDPPYNAKVIFKPSQGSATGWNAPTTEPWLSRALDQASNQYFGAPCGYIGQGGTIPLMNMLEKGFPKAQFMVCGVLGPKSNAHGPNEFLHVPFGKKLTAAVAQVIASAATKQVA
ncbi:M20 family metallopeptidase [Undibacterium terreum]|uniref:Peptidase n=1 Tax=Undibacterium terreum TaxID=1224302 RepID=A0A916XFJ2_9BURK|nr:M20 family metallopeptidase [Undibacterium terreum]GGC68170.1 peptidase [Undibacterium terreum]